MTQVTAFKKPTLEAVQAFAEGGAKAKPKTKTASGQVPAGDVRLTVNIREDLHQRLKIRAVEQRTTVGDLIEEWIQTWR